MNRYYEKLNITLSQLPIYTLLNDVRNVNFNGLDKRILKYILGVA